jgi:hypothetical protein
MNTMLDRLRALYQREPARLIAIIVAVVLFVANRVGLVLDDAGLGEAIGVALFVLLGGEVTRSKVSPAAPEIGPDSDALLAAAHGRTGSDED